MNKEKIEKIASWALANGFSEESLVEDFESAMEAYESRDSSGRRKVERKTISLAAVGIAGGLRIVAATRECENTPKAKKRAMGALQFAASRAGYDNISFVVLEPVHVRDDD